MTACFTSLPRYCSAVSFILVSTIDETSSGMSCFVSPFTFTEIIGLPPLFTMSNGRSFLSLCTDFSSYLRPMRRFTSKSLGGVDCRLRLGSLANQTFIFGESNVRRRDAVALVVRNDLYATVLVDSDTRVRRAQIDPDDGAVDLVLSGRKRGKEKCGAHGVLRIPSLSQ